MPSGRNSVAPYQPMEAVMYKLNQLKKKHPEVIKEGPMTVAAALYLFIFLMHV